MSQQRPLDDERPLLSPWNYALPTAGELAALRDQAGLSQQDVSQRIGVKRQTLGRWEKGDASPSVDTARELLGIYRASIISAKNSNQ